MIKYKRYERYKDSGVEWIGEIPEEWEFRRISHICTLGRGRVISKIEIAENEGEYPVYSSQTENDGVLGYINTYDFEGDYVTWTTDGANAGTVFRRTGRFNCTNVCGTLKPKENNLDLSYLTYALSLETKRYVRLDINPKLMNNEMAKIRVLFPPSDEQKAIANFLDQKTAEIDSLIADKEKLIELLQEKRQAIITEAVTKGLNPNVKMKDSGIKWIGEIPEHWEVKRIKYLATVNPSKSEVRHLPPEQEVTFIPMEKIVATGKVDYSITNTVENLIDGYTYFRDGDIIMAKVTPCFENGNIAIVNGLLNGIGFGTTELHVLRCNNKCYNKFLFYYLQSDVFKSKGISEMYGVAGLKRIPTDFVLNYKLGIPDYQEQKQITLYLDTIVDKINTLISDIQTQIDKLKEYRQSIISEAVTGKIKIYNS